MSRLVLLALLLAASPTLADEDVVTPGVQDEAPGPEDELTPPEVETEVEGRRSIRGVVNGGNLEPAWMASERAADAALVPRAGARPWLDDEERSAAPPPPTGATAPKDLPPIRTDDLPPRRPEQVRPDLPWLRDIHTGDLPIRWDPRLIRYLEYYKSDPRGRATMSGWLRAQGRYRELILSTLRRHNLPEDLLYVCMIESSYDPLTLSRVGASGLWQFMPHGGRIYGLPRTYWVDDRRDPEKSTEAVALYFQDLYDRFGNWDLALAAFNAGYGAVLRSIAKYNTNDFWRLLDLEAGLPWESSVYVPKALAAALVGRNRALFGYEGVTDLAPFEFDRVLVPGGASLAAIARAAGTDDAELRRLNPALRRNRVPPDVKEYAVRIPKGKKDVFARAFPQLRGDWDTVDAYVLRHGERFEDVAMTYGVSPAKLRELNGVDDLAELRGGTTIVVPRLDEAARKRNLALAEELLYHSDVIPGEPADPLLVPVPDKGATVPERRRVFYRVVGGDTLEEIAAALDVRAGDLARWNAVEEDARIQPRMILAAWVASSFDADARHVFLLDERRLEVVTSGSDEHLDAIEARRGRVRIRVTVKRGDTLESLGKPHHLSKYDVARINRRSYRTPLEPGEELVLYKVVDERKAKAAGVFSKRPKDHYVPAKSRKAKSPAKEKRGEGEAQPPAKKAEKGVKGVKAVKKAAKGEKSAKAASKDGPTKVARRDPPRREQTTGRRR